jgi:flavin-dependent dehydrogenase
VIRSPVATALDTESHVGKHTLVIGDAGGFVAAASNEGIYPAMWSAQIAAEVIENALHANRSQDELISFDSAWRMQMADYLRSPHTDIQFLLPLIFSNQPMANRMGAAFFHGENI